MSPANWWLARGGITSGVVRQSVVGPRRNNLRVSSAQFGGEPLLDQQTDITLALTMAALSLKNAQTSGSHSARSESSGSSTPSMSASLGFPGRRNCSTPSHCQARYCTKSASGNPSSNAPPRWVIFALFELVAGGGMPPGVGCRFGGWPAETKPRVWPANFGGWPPGERPLRGNDPWVSPAHL